MIMPMYYHRDGTPVDDDGFNWARYFESFGNRRVALTRITDPADPTQQVNVSTVFLGLNHQYVDGPPLIFESMSFDDSDTDDEDQRQDRYATEAQALIGHRRMVAEIAAAMPDARVEDIDDERLPARPEPEEEPPTTNAQWAGLDEYTFLDATSSGGWLFLPPLPSAQKQSSDILERIDAATGCQQCEGPSHAGDFCTPECLQAWNAQHAVPLPRAEDAALVYPGYDFAHWDPDRA